MALLKALGTEPKCYNQGVSESHTPMLFMGAHPYLGSAVDLGLLLFGDQN